MYMGLLSGSHEVPEPFLLMGRLRLYACDMSMALACELSLHFLLLRLYSVCRLMMMFLGANPAYE